MPVDVTCNPDIKVVKVKVSAGQRLRHTIEDDDRGVEFNLVNDKADKMLETSKSPRTIEWPNPKHRPSGAEDKHTLGMQFTARASVKWKVELLSSSGSVLQTLKECEYSNDGGVRAHFNTLEIRVR